MNISQDKIYEMGNKLAVKADKIYGAKRPVSMENFIILRKLKKIAKKMMVSKTFVKTR